MDNRVEGVRGWGVPSETIFEVGNLLTILNKDFLLNFVHSLDVQFTWTRRQTVIQSSSVLNNCSPNFYQLRCSSY